MSAHGNPFGDGPPPPGFVAAFGRAYILAGYNGPINSVPLMHAIDQPEVRKELGLSDNDVRKLRARRDEATLAMINRMGEYYSKGQEFSPDDAKKLQAEVESELANFGTKIESSVSPEQWGKARTLVFQVTGGLNSPILGPDSLAMLDLDKAQQEKAKRIFKEMEAERLAVLESGLAMIEKDIAQGGPKKSEEDAVAGEKEQKALEARMWATSKKLGAQMREILTDEQRRRVDHIMTTRPAFLPPLPPQLQGDQDGEYKPGADSWQPGDGAPAKIRLPSVFPLGND